MNIGLRRSQVSFCIYEGITTTYPKWFRQEIVDHTYVDEFGYSVYNLDVLTEGWDVFIRNRYGDIRRIDMDTFDRCYFIITDSVAVLQGDQLECFVYKEDEDLWSLPHWVIEAMQDGYIYKEYGTWWCINTNDDGGEIPMDSNWSVVQNRDGDIMYMPLHVLNELFVTEVKV